MEKLYQFFTPFYISNTQMAHMGRALWASLKTVTIKIEYIHSVKL